MPVSPYPRLGHPLVPRRLAEVLDEIAPSEELRLQDLDASVWDRYGPEACVELARSAVDHVHGHQRALVETLGSERVPPLPEGLGLEDLDLEGRTSRLLGDPDRRTALRGRRRLTVGGLLARPGAGVKALLDLLTSLEAAAAGVVVTAPRNLAELTRCWGEIPRHLRHCRLPELPDPMRLTALARHARLQWVLRRIGWEDEPAAWRRLTVGMLLAVRGVGPGKVAEFVETLHRYHEAESREGAGLWAPRDLRRQVSRTGRIPAHLRVCRVPPLPETVRLSDLAQETRVFRALRRAGFEEAPSKLQEYTLGELLKLRGLYTEGILHLIENAYRIREPAGPRTFDETMAELLSADEPHRRDMVLEFLGWSGRTPRTFASLGREYGLTREAVRQVVYRHFKPRTLNHAAVREALQWVLERINRDLPIPATVLEERLQAENVVSRGTRLEVLQRLAQALRQESGFVLVGRREHRWAVAPADQKSVEPIRKTVQALIVRRGVSTLEQVRRRVGRGAGPQPRKELVVNLLRWEEGFRWLEERSGSFWLEGTADNALRRAIDAALFLRSPMPAGTLREALRRQGQAIDVPPPRILKEFCRQAGGYRFRKGRIAAASGSTRRRWAAFRAYLGLLARLALGPDYEARVSVEEIVEKTLRTARRRWKDCPRRPRAAEQDRLLTRLLSEAPHRSAWGASLAREVDEARDGLDNALDRHAPEIKTAGFEGLLQFAEALQRLPEDKRLALERRDLHGLSPAEAARRCNRSGASVGSLKGHAWKTLRSLFPGSQGRR